ncbi:MAG: succinylglutamate desuccinylase/aspartoacylase family protein [Myxococcota bacterium]
MIAAVIRHRSAPLLFLLVWLVSASPALAEDVPAADLTDDATTAGAQTEAPEPLGPFALLHQEVQPGALSRLTLRTSESFAGAWVETPVAVAHGTQPGETLCVVAGIHGDEVNGVEVVRRLLNQIDPETLRGTLVAVPIANLSAFRRGSRYLPDRRDLNRYFPGRAFGSAASRIAHGLFDGVFRHCDALVDLHTGSFQRSNLQQLRAHLGDPETLKLAVDFGAGIVVNKIGRTGTLRRSATDLGIPAITVEAGESTRFDEVHVAEALAGIERLLRNRGMIADPSPAPAPEPPMAYLKTRWVRADRGGILVSRVALGDPVEPGQVLGAISDPLSDAMTIVGSPISGRVIGMAVDQVVMPGFAVFHLAYDAYPLSSDTLLVPTIPDVSADAAPEELDLDERPE